MGNRDRFWKLSLLNLRVLYVLGVVIAVLVLVDLSLFSYGGYESILSSVYLGKMYGVVKIQYFSKNSTLDNVHVGNGNGFDKEGGGKERKNEVLLLGKGENGDSELHSSVKSKKGLGIGKEEDLADLAQLNNIYSSNGSLLNNALDGHGRVNSIVNGNGFDKIVFNREEEGKARKHGVLFLGKGENATSLAIEEDKELKKSISLESPPIKTADSFISRIAVMKKREKAIPISHMNSILLRNSAASKQVRLLRSSASDRELEKARVEIENAPILRDVSQLHASVFRNFSMFSRSYQLMERLLKVYIYREGAKPIFHQPHMRGIYASEGWFMKLMEANKQFIVKDAKKAHLFYLPFSSQKLRSAFNTSSFFSHKDLRNHLDNYVLLIAKKYRFWNRTMGTDHFLVGCHDWAPGFTRNKMSNCIRALCNANVARDFKIGKDVSLPVTYIRSAERPLEFVAWNPPSERNILAFFAGGMHGYLRPVLLEYWNDKEPDMKIFGSLPRDTEGKARYREFMKTSRYCICAKGYEVHTPRVVESIYSGCVPVIISDNYVPPFFEILDWEGFSVFILEKDIPDLRSILLSISEEKYITMHQRLKSVQQHFLWHKKPQKYDLFHMILHSVWYNRVFQMKHG